MTALLLLLAFCVDLGTTVYTRHSADAQFAAPGALLTTPKGGDVALSADGDVLLVGVPDSEGFGAAHVYEREWNMNENTFYYEYKAQLQLPNSPHPPQLRSLFGTAVALDGPGDWALIGAPGYHAKSLYQSGAVVADSGAGFLFRRTVPGGVWQYHGMMARQTENDHCGYAVALSASANTAAISCESSDAQYPDDGAVFYHRTREQDLADSYGSGVIRPPSAEWGSGQRFGSSLSVSRDGLTLAIGTETRAANVAYIAETSGEHPIEWTLSKLPLPVYAVPADVFVSVAVDQDPGRVFPHRLIVGCPNCAQQRGAVFVCQRNELVRLSVWQCGGQLSYSQWPGRRAEQEVLGSPKFGQSVALSGSLALVGMPDSGGSAGNDPRGVVLAYNVSAASVLLDVAPLMYQEDRTLVCPAAGECHFGQHLALASDIAAAGAVYAISAPMAANWSQVVSVSTVSGIRAVEVTSPVTLPETLSPTTQVLATGDTPLITRQGQGSLAPTPSFGTSKPPPPSSPPALSSLIDPDLIPLIAVGAGGGFIFLCIFLICCTYCCVTRVRGRQAKDAPGDGHRMRAPTRARRSRSSTARSRSRTQQQRAGSRHNIHSTGKSSSDYGIAPPALSSAGKPNSDYGAGPPSISGGSSSNKSSAYGVAFPTPATSTRRPGTDEYDQLVLGRPGSDSAAHLRDGYEPGPAVPGVASPPGDYGFRVPPPNYSEVDASLSPAASFQCPVCHNKYPTEQDVSIHMTKRH